MIILYIYIASVVGSFVILNIETYKCSKIIKEEYPNAYIVDFEPTWLLHKFILSALPFYNIYITYVTCRDIEEITQYILDTYE